MKKYWKSLVLVPFAALAITSCEDVPEPYTIPTSSDTEADADTETSVEALGTGTADDPYNVAAANDVCAALSKSSTSATYLSETVYVQGIISQIDEVSTSYGNATYYISDDGSTTDQLEVYHGYYLNNAKFTSEDQIAVGDTVVVCGQLQNWLGTYEFTGYSYIVSLNGSGTSSDDDTSSSTDEEATGDGTAANPYNAVAAVAAGQALGSGGTGSYVYVTGIVSSISELSTSYGNATYYISADGTTSSTQFYVYRGYYLDEAKFTSSSQLEVGDSVVVYGQMINYYGTSELAQYNYLVSVTKADGTQVEGDGEEEEDSDTEATSEGITVSSNVITIVNGDVTAGSTTVTVDLSTYGFENGYAVTSVDFDGGTITFDQNDGNNAPKFYTATNGVRLYAQNSLTITGSSKAIAKVVITCDYSGSTYYVGNDARTMSTSGTSLTLTNAYESTSGGTQLRVQTLVITFAE